MQAKGAYAVKCMNMQLARPEAQLKSGVLDQNINGCLQYTVLTPPQREASTNCCDYEAQRHYGEQEYCRALASNVTMISTCSAH